MNIIVHDFLIDLLQVVRFLSVLFRIDRFTGID